MKERLPYIDLIKCFAIFLVVWGHVMQNWGNTSDINIWITFNFILSFHMPLFAMVSGMFFSDSSSFFSYTYKKAKQLLWPLIIWSIIVFGFVNVIKDGYLFLNGGEKIHIFATIRNIYYSIIEWSWWFLRALFLCFVYASIVVNMGKSHKCLSLLASFVLLYAACWSGFIPNLDIKLNGFFFLYPFFCLGIFLNKYIAFVNKYSLQLLFLSLAIYVTSLFFWEGWKNTFYQMNTSLFEESGYLGVVGREVVRLTIIRLVAGCSGSLFFILIFKYISGYILKRECISKILLQIGRNTLGIYILHSFAFDIFGKKLQCAIIPMGLLYCVWQYL